MAPSLLRGQGPEHDQKKPGWEGLGALLQPVCVGDASSGASWQWALWSGFAS